MIGIRYQCYATDDISTEVVYMDTYEFNEENDIIKISYKDLDDEELVTPTNNTNWTNQDVQVTITGTD